MGKILKRDIEIALKVLNAHAAFERGLGNEEAAERFDRAANEILYRGEVPILREGGIMYLRPAPSVRLWDADDGLPSPAASRRMIVRNGRIVDLGY